MNHPVKNRECNRRMGIRACRGGATSLEAIMAFTLLGSVLAASTPLLVRHKRLIAGQREYRLALDEVSNQLERLSILPRDGLATAVEQLRPSDFAAAHLPDVKLGGKVDRVDDTQHVQIMISWGGEQRPASAITLAAWFFQKQNNASPSADRRVSP
jgi:hypothetical protein